LVHDDSIKEAASRSLHWVRGIKNVISHIQNISGLSTIWMEIDTSS